MKFLTYLLASATAIQVEMNAVTLMTSQPTADGFKALASTSE